MLRQDQAVLRGSQSHKRGAHQWRGVESQRLGAIELFDPVGARFALDGLGRGEVVPTPGQGYRVMDKLKRGTTGAGLEGNALRT